MRLFFYPILFHVPVSQGAGGAAPLFLTLPGLPWLEGEAGGLVSMGSESTESKAH